MGGSWALSCCSPCCSQETVCLHVFGALVMIWLTFPAMASRPWQLPADSTRKDAVTGGVCRLWPHALTNSCTVIRTQTCCWFCTLHMQEVIAAKGRRMMATETRLMSTLYPTPEVQQERMQELERTRQEQLAAQAAERYACLRVQPVPRPARRACALSTGGKQASKLHSRVTGNPTCCVVTCGPHCHAVPAPLLL